MPYWCGNSRKLKPRKPISKRVIRIGGLPIAVTEEASHHLIVAGWLDYHNIFFFHPNNGARRNAREGVLLRALGLKAGVSDLIIMDPPPAYPDKVGMIIEMKAPKGRLEDTQKEFLTKAEKRNWLTAVCYGAEEAIKDLQKAGYGMTIPRPRL